MEDRGSGWKRVTENGRERIRVEKSGRDGVRGKREEETRRARKNDVE